MSLILCLLLAITGEIRLQVKDPSGAAMEASVKLDGVRVRGAAFKNLPFGVHSLEISKPGFTTQTVAIDVESETPITRTVTMTLSAFSSQIEVVAVTPLHGVDIPLNEIAAPVQVATQAEIAQSGALDLSDFMNRRLNGVYVNEMQGNPAQPDVNYRGYTASPLLGTPQGLSVYLDGVRENQPFGDVVSWDLIPANAIAEVVLMPGSNPVFGLNTLGGALSIRTKDGVTNPGLAGALTYGSSGRKALEAEYGGGAAARFNWFLAANAFHESGWRIDSPSDIRQGFARFGWRTAATDLGFTASYAYNTLTGNGLQDYRLLARDYNSVYTIPDTTGNRSPSFRFHAQHSAGASLAFSGNVWYRNIRTEGINGNANTNSFDQPAAISSCLANTDPIDLCNAITVYSKTVQNEYGLSGQANWAAHRQQLTVGATVDRGTVTFTQNTQFGYLNPNYTITGINAWEDDARVNLHGVTPNASVFATDTISLAKSLHVTLSGRFNRSAIGNSDYINPGGGAGSLDAHDVFSRFNGAVGVTYSASQYVNAYVSYAQGSRAPTSIELGCADPNNPCNLPNALASDPPLKQVVTGTWEAGLRGKLEQGVSWTLGAFRAENTNDILFVASQQTGTGYFKNFGQTRREGVQASVDAHIRRVTGGLDYTFLAATYQSTEIVDGSANNTSNTALAGLPGLDGVITIHPGNRIPLVPKQTGKAFVNVQAMSKLAFNVGLVAASSSYARGNENNACQADGKYYLGPGVSAGYAVANFSAHYDLNRHLQLAVQADNLFNRHYATAAQLAVTGFTSQGTFLARPFPAYSTGGYPLQSATFLAPGAPRRAWVELRLKF